MERSPDIGLVGNVGAGEIFPARTEPLLPDFDARTRALEAFGKFLSTLEFQRTGEDGGSAVPFRVARKDIHIEWPDHPEELVFPCIAFLPSRAGYNTFGLGPARIIPETIGVFGEGTALLNLAEYAETIIVEVRGSKKAERRAMMAGIEVAMGSFDNSWAVTLVLQDYFDVSATYSLMERENIDDPDNARNRRRGHFYIEMTTCLVRLVDVNTMCPVANVFVDVDC